jgi:restriction endonuclease Mrr
LQKIKGINKKDINELKEIVQQAKRLEELIKEIEGPLTDEQSKNLSHEFFCMGAVSVRPIDDVVSRIDSALHHPEEYQ